MEDSNVNEIQPGHEERKKKPVVGDRFSGKVDTAWLCSKRFSHEKPRREGVAKKPHDENNRQNNQTDC